jgi:NAD(P)-dependent dehydrogenase (short-subunit alcohol dehydrogenase family)
MNQPTALITGGQQGIGLGIARVLRRAGFRLVLAAELPADAPAVRAVLAELGPECRYLRHDLGEVGPIAALLDAAGPVDALIQNAGVPARLRGDMLDLTPDNFDFVLNVNLRGAFFLAQAVAKRMLAAESANYRSIIFITSVSAAMASVERADYCISKAGAAMAARALALRLAPHGIGVFDVRPGIIETGMTAAVKETYDARIAGGLVPAGRWGRPEDVGAAILPLVTGQMAFATGAVIPVDGGLSVQRL